MAHNIPLLNLWVKVNNDAISDLELDEDSGTMTEMKTILAFSATLDICETVSCKFQGGGSAL